MWITSPLEPILNHHIDEAVSQCQVLLANYLENLP